MYDILATSAVDPTPEFCFAKIQWWATCMTKAEWAAWASALFTFIAIGGAVVAAYLQVRAMRRERIEAAADAIGLRAQTVRLMATRLKEFCDCYPPTDGDTRVRQGPNELLLSQLQECHDCIQGWRLDEAILADEMLLIQQAKFNARAVQGNLPNPQDISMTNDLHAHLCKWADDLDEFGDKIFGLAATHLER